MVLGTINSGENTTRKRWTGESIKYILDILILKWWWKMSENVLHNTCVSSEERLRFEVKMWCHLFIGRYWNCDYEDSSQGRYKEWAETHFWKGKEEQLLKASKKAGRKDKRYSGTDVFTDTQIGRSYWREQ